jgi:hypothetical protein
MYKITEEELNNLLILIQYFKSSRKRMKALQNFLILNGSNNPNAAIIDIIDFDNSFGINLDMKEHFMSLEQKRYSYIKKRK